ncbi:H3 protein, partial [Thalassarche chlororhynchos]|nr:H3 protein [Thalassarche chlororhynchos]
RRPAPAPWKKLRLPRKKTLKLLPAASFCGLVRGFSVSRESFGVQAAAVAALREGCEAQLLALLEEWGLCALHAKRAAVQTADVSLVRCLRVKRG